MTANRINTTTYTYDAVNRLSAVTDPDGGETVYSYDPVGNRSTVTYPNGTVADYDYDELNRLTKLTNSQAGGAVISSYEYTLGPAGNRERVVEDSNRTVDYGYDDLYRLTSETVTNDPAGNNFTTTYTYDQVGNRLEMHTASPTGEVMVTYTYGDDLISMIRPETGTSYYHYDGQMSTRQLTDVGGTATDTLSSGGENRPPGRAFKISPTRPPARAFKIGHTCPPGPMPMSGSGCRITWATGGRQVHPVFKISQTRPPGRGRVRRVQRLRVRPADASPSGIS